MACECTHEELEQARLEARELGIGWEHETQMLADLARNQCGWCGERVDKRKRSGRERLEA